MIAFHHRSDINHQLRRQKLAVAANATGEITGHEKQAAERIAQFDKQLAAAKEQIKWRPPQPVTAIVYTAAAHSANLWTPESAQGQMLEQLALRCEVARRLKRQPKPGQTP